MDNFTGPVTLNESDGKSLPMMSATNPNAAGKNIPRRYDIEGAPLHIGAKLLINNLIDTETLDYLAGDSDICLDDTVSELEGSLGVLVHYDYDCGCGQIFPDQPMIGIRIETGKFKGKVVEFLPEELIEKPVL